MPEVSPRRKSAVAPVVPCFYLSSRHAAAQSRITGDAFEHCHPEITLKRKRKHKQKESFRWEQPHGTPTEDYLANVDFDDPGTLEECMEEFIYDLQTDHFLTWEGVMRMEQDLPLSERQEELLEELMTFAEDPDDYIHYIDEMARPGDPWHTTARKLASALLLDVFDTARVLYEVETEGWPELAACLEKECAGLSLPEGVAHPRDVIGEELRHRLWLQSGFDALSGLGQDSETTLKDSDQQYRIKALIQFLARHRDTVAFLDLTLNKLWKFLTMPEADRMVFTDLFVRQLQLQSHDAPLLPALPTPDQLDT